MTKETLYQKFLESLGDNDYEVISHYNLVVSENKKIYRNNYWFFDNILIDEGFESLYSKFLYGDYTSDHDYITFDEKGNFKTFDECDLRKYINLDNLFELILLNYNWIQYSLDEDLSCDFDEYFETLKL